MNLHKFHRSFFLKQVAIVLLALVLLQPLVNAIVLFSVENYELELVQADDETSSNENEKQEKDSEEKLELQMAVSSSSQLTLQVAQAFYTTSEEVWECSMEIPIPPPELS
jgi:short subunit fatty acids transporter